MITRCDCTGSPGVVGCCNAGRQVPGSRGTGTIPGLTLPGLANCHSPRVPPGAAGAHAARAGVVLDLARADVRRRGRAHAGHLLRARPRDLRRDARHRDHRGRGVPLPAPPARRDAVRRPQRDGPGAAGRGRRRRDPDPAARHLLPRRRVRPRARGRAGALLRRGRARLGRAGGRVRRPAGGRGDPLGARRPAATSWRWSSRPPRGCRCTCTSPSRSPRTRPASPPPG